MTELAYIGSYIAVLVSVFAVVAAFRERNRALARRDELRWLQNNAKRAVAQLDSANEQDVLAGLQTLSALRDPSLVRDVLQRAERIRQHSENAVLVAEAVRVHELFSRLAVDCVPAGKHAA